jgi:hypothetical protein
MVAISDQNKDPPPTPVSQQRQFRVLATTRRKALKRYAMENDVKVHDLMLEAMEVWFESHGLSGPVRVQPDASR